MKSSFPYVAACSFFVLAALFTFIMYSDNRILELAIKELSFQSSGRSNPPRFYLISKETAEDLVPDLATCGISVYGDEAHQVLLNHPARCTDVADASLIVVPPLNAWETNWPVYGGGSGNLVRQGESCLP